MSLLGDTLNHNISSLTPKRFKSFSLCIMHLIHLWESLKSQPFQPALLQSLSPNLWDSRQTLICEFCKKTKQVTSNTQWWKRHRVNIPIPKERNGGTEGGMGPKQDQNPAVNIKSYSSMPCALWCDANPEDLGSPAPMVLPATTSSPPPGLALITACDFPW
jgi:hypothetical protein